MECKYCKGICAKNGSQVNGAKKYYCKICGKYQQSVYSYNAYAKDIDEKIIMYTKESCGIRSTARILHISTGTVMERIMEIAKGIEKPSIFKNKEYEMDEMRTYIGKRTNKYWVSYAIRKDTREVMDFKVGKRNKKTLKIVVDTLLLSEARKICTDGYMLYQYLIPALIHTKSKYKINYIERKNLSIRTHLKRLGRRTICFSKSMLMLEACLKIYFWS